MNAKNDQKERSYEGILESASRLVRERGIKGARVGDVMKGAGLTVGGFYAHFASKEALVDETLRRTARRLRAILFARIDDKPASARVEVILKRYLSAAHRDDFTFACALPAIASEVGTTAPEYRDVVNELVSELARELENHVPDSAGLPRRTLALGLVALMVGGLTLSRALSGTPLSDDVLKACRAVGTFASRAL